MTPTRPIVFVLTALLPLSAAGAQADAASEAAYKAAMEGYIRFLPRYYAVTTMDRFTAVDEPTQTPQAPVNQLGYRDGRTDHRVDWIVRANPDTVLAAGFIDLSQGPLLLRVPKADKRYWRVQLTDLWTEVARTGLSSLHDAGPGVYAIAGPDHPGDVPGAVRTIRAAENLNFLSIGVSPKVVRREGPNDGEIDGTLKVLRQFTLGPAGTDPPKRARRSDEARPVARSLHVATRELATHEPLQLLDAIRDAVARPGTPMTDADRAALSALSRHLDAALADDAASLANQRQASAMAEALAAARLRIDNRIRRGEDGANGWTTLSPADWGDRLLDRAAAAEYALFADRGGQVMWMECHADEHGEPLRGDRRYLILFDKDATPPADAFWSLTSYRDDTLAPGENSLDRNSLGTLAYKLKTRKGGKTLLFIQHVRPDEGKIISWLPAPAGNFNLVLRVYGPSEAMRRGDYTMPRVIRSDIHVGDPLKLLDD